MNNQEKLSKILKELFQLDRSDLDFGIYRIMNSKSVEIQNFLDNDLLASVKEAFSKSENATDTKELETLIKTITDAGMNPDDSPKVQELKEKLSSISSSSSLENDVFSHLSTFFSRYYKDGDFVSLRRYKKDTYAIPYEGEEVKLHWANSDQYYIKSGEYFRDYSFTVGENKNEKKIHFKLSDAQTESNNNKASSEKERRFVISENNPCEIIDDELCINFEYKAVGKLNQETVLNSEAIEKILQKLIEISDTKFLQVLNELAPTEKNKNRTLLEKHLKNYTSRNSFDYFIHKDLGGFLSRELDFYIKNEILFLDDIMHSSLKYEEVMKKVKIFKEVAQKLISFLSQLEELQKKLWEKKKFVIETNYCLTLDKINEKHFPEILENKEQLAEWKNLFDVEIKTLEDLKAEKFLVLDTKFFSTKFKYSLLSVFENLDEEIDGVLINSENFGALHLLQERYKEQVKTVYIDPPYNTGNDGFLYNDSFQHSSWMSFMYDRIETVTMLLNKDGVLLGSIDDNELDNFYLLLKILKFNYVKILPTIMNLKGNNDEYAFSGAHEYTIASSLNKTQKSFSQLNLEDEELEQWEIDEIGLYKKGAPLRATGEEGHREDRPLMFYPLLIDYESKIVKTITPDEFSKLYNKDTKKFDDEYLNNLELKYNSEGFSSVLPKVDEVKFGRWRWGYNDNTIRKLSTEVLFSKTKSGYSLNKKQRPDIGDVPTKKPKSFFYKPEYSSGNGTAEQKSIFEKKIFANPKPLALIFDLIKLSTNENNTILDYFAGSGTTGHAVINLNREDNGKRKYLLVEMGEYFDTVTKPRIQKVIYTDSWKDGKPQNKNGISQIFKYFKLESYEDTLNNLEFTKTAEQKETLDFYPEIKEEYMLNYSLGFESEKSLLNIENFSSPFDYTLKIATSSVGETKNTNIDLIETFNYLLGLVVEKTELKNGFVIISGKNLKGSKIIIIWRDNKTNEELNEFVENLKNQKNISLEAFDEIYINGDNNIEGSNLVEQKFKEVMFGK